MLDIMYEIPKDENIGRVTITRDYIEGKASPLIEIRGDSDTAKKFIDNLAVFSLLANVADVKSLVIHPYTTTHSQLTDDELLDQGIKPNTIRLSLGTENVKDLIAALDGAFAAVK